MSEGRRVGSVMMRVTSDRGRVGRPEAPLLLNKDTSSVREVWMLGHPVPLRERATRRASTHDAIKRALSLMILGREAKNFRNGPLMWQQ